MKSGQLPELKLVLSGNNISQRFWLSIDPNQGREMNYIWIEDLSTDPSMKNLQKTNNKIDIPDGMSVSRFTKYSLKNTKDI